MKRCMFAHHGISSIRSLTYCIPSAPKVKMVVAAKTMKPVNFVCMCSVKLVILKYIVIQAC